MEEIEDRDINKCVGCKEHKYTEDFYWDDNNEEGAVCLTCFADSYIVCYYCAKSIPKKKTNHVELENKEYACTSCSKIATEEMKATGNFTERTFNRGSKDFLSTEKGAIIKSARTFGVEIELLNNNMSNIDRLSNSVPKEYGFEHDGSIRADDGYGMEVITPVMSGRIGEKAIKLLMSKINRLDFFVNSSCGMHVHLGSDGFKQQKNVITSNFKDRNEIDPPNSDVKDMFLLTKELVDSIISITILEKNRVIESLRNSYNTESLKNRLDIVPFFHVPTEKEFGDEIHVFVFLKNIKYRKGTMTLPMFFNTDKGNAEKLIALKENLINVYNSGKDNQYYNNLQEAMKDSKLFPLIRANDIFSVFVEDSSFKNLRTLLYLYTVYTDVFLSMLPKSRREHNSYCQKLYNTFSPTDIKRTINYEELEKLWYKEEDMNVVRDREVATHKYDNSRYYGVNLHSLFSRAANGTVEIRWHSGTLDTESILYWISLHQHILDTVSRGEIHIEDMQEAIDMFSVEEKRNHLLGLLELRPSLAKYVVSRYDHFSNSDGQKQ